jgi:hypothetical protein
MNAPGDGFRETVSGIGLFFAQSDLNHTGFILHKLSHGFPAHGPLRLQVCNAVTRVQDTSDSE